MWRLVVLFVMSIYGVRLCYGQQFTDDLKTMMTYLPRTADDFHSKYYDTDLESAMSVSSSSLCHKTIEGIPIMKHNGSINSLTVQFYGMKKDESQCLMWFNRLSLENQLEVAEDFDENPKIKCTIGLVINMYEEIAKTKNYEAMKRFAELSVEYRGYDNAVKALNLLESAKNVSYSTKNADVYMLWGKLHERQGNIGEAISCYRNSGTQEGRERAIMLNR